MASSYPKLCFQILAEEAERNKTLCRQDRLADTLFVLPCNDGEAKRAGRILTALAAPFVYVSKQRWGASLDKDMAQLKAQFGSFNKVKRILVFEMPAQEQNGVLVAERYFTDLGLELVIIDHHDYRWVDRSHPLSSLEQLCAWLDWPLSPTDVAIAVNDRSYIPGLKKLGLSKEQIVAVRYFDLLAQGFAKSYIDRQNEGVKTALQSLALQKKGELWWICGEQKIERTFLLQELALRAADGVAHSLELRGNKLSFSGSPSAANHLKQIDFRSFGFESGYTSYSGGDEASSKFWGFRPRYPHEAISEAFLAYIFSELGRFLKI